MQKMHQCHAQRPFVVPLGEPHYACRETRKGTRKSVIDAYRNFMEKEADMTARRNRGRRTVRLAASALARPAELIGDSLPELLLLTAVVAGVLGAWFGLDGVS
jgi:hypothetical protein